MRVRGITGADFKEIRDIWEKFYADEFEFPDFVSHFLCGTVVTDDDRNIITAGGVRTIAEAIVITNKELPVKDRREALYKMLNVFLYNAHVNKYQEMHAFVQEPSWREILQRRGFRITKGNALVIDV